MKFFNRNIIVCILAFACERAISADSVPPRHPGRSLLFFPPFISMPKPNKPFSIFSRPHQPSADEQHKGQQANEGGGIVGNVLHGGSIGIEIRPLAPLQEILEHAKKFIPGHGGRGTVGRPSHEKPEPPHQDRPHHDRPPKHERPPHKEQNPYERPHQQRPGHQRPNSEQPPPEKEEDNKEWEEAEVPSRPQWEDIGEVPSEEYGEGVLQPRRRPKRFVESKIYHVPLLFRSNGRAERVRIRERNRLRLRKSSED